MAKRKFNAKQFFADLDSYVSLVQSDVHVRRVRVAIAWSIISLIYIYDVLQVEFSSEPALWGVSIRGLTDTKLFVFLFAMNLYYSVRFGFSVAKIWIVVHPFVLWRDIKEYREVKKLTSTLKTARDIEKRMPHIQAFTWDMDRSFPRGKKDAKGRDLNIPKYAPPQKIENEIEVRHYNMRHPIFGVLENFVVLLLLPAGLCIVALVSFVVKYFLGLGGLTSPSWFFVN